MVWGPMLVLSSSLFWWLLLTSLVAATVDVAAADLATLTDSSSTEKVHKQTCTLRLKTAQQPYRDNLVFGPNIRKT